LLKLFPKLPLKISNFVIKAKYIFCIIKIIIKSGLILIGRSKKYFIENNGMCKKNKQSQNGLDPARNN